jgi:hypothetical protein
LQRGLESLFANDQPLSPALRITYRQRGYALAEAFGTVAFSKHHGLSSKNKIDLGVLKRFSSFVYPHLRRFAICTPPLTNRTPLLTVLYHPFGTDLNTIYSILGAENRSRPGQGQGRVSEVSVTLDPE